MITAATTTSTTTTATTGVAFRGYTRDTSPSVFQLSSRYVKLRDLAQLLGKNKKQRTFIFYKVLAREPYCIILRNSLNCGMDSEFCVLLYILKNISIMD